MTNTEDETTANQNTEENNKASNDETASAKLNEQQSNGSDKSAEGQMADTTHNTGNEHMSIDEEGSEVGPDDEV